MPNDVGETVLVVASFQKVGDVLVDGLWKPGPPRSSRSIGDELVLNEDGENVLDEGQPTSLEKGCESAKRLEEVKAT